MNMEYLGAYIIAVVFGLIAIALAVRMFKYGSFRGAVLGGRVVKMHGEVKGNGSARSRPGTPAPSISLS